MRFCNLLRFCEFFWNKIKTQKDALEILILEKKHAFLPKLKAFKEQEMNFRQEPPTEEGFYDAHSCPVFSGCTIAFHQSTQNDTLGYCICHFLNNKHLEVKQTTDSRVF